MDIEKLYAALARILEHKYDVEITYEITRMKDDENTKCKRLEEGIK